jgi:hypothetical protein
MFGRQDMYLFRPGAGQRVSLTSRAVPFENEKMGADQWLPIWVRNEHLNQASKIPRFAYDKVEHHAVVPLDGARQPECLVAVCSGPRKK